MTLSSSSAVRTFLVTGATDGIGRHTAQKLAADGYGLVVHGRRNVGTELVKELTEKGAAFCHYVQCDLGDLEQVREFAAKVQECGIEKLDVLINNAGVFDPTPNTSAQGYDMTWAVNVMSPFVITHDLLPLLAKGSEQRIITTSSISQAWSLPPIDKLFAKDNPSKFSGHSAYSNSKLGDYMFTVQLSKILAKHDKLQNANCLTMDPGTVNTKMLLAGWGACGIPVKRADNTYKLAATPYGAQQKSGTYHFAGSGSRDARDTSKLQSLWDALEQHTGCNYKQMLGTIA